MGEVAIAVTLSVHLAERLKEIARAECRPLTGQGIFALKVLVGAARRKPGLRLVSEALPDSPMMKYHTYFRVPEEVFDYLLDWGGRKGIKLGRFCRLVMENFVWWHDQIKPGAVLAKEEFIDEVVKRDCAQTLTVQ